MWTDTHTHFMSICIVNIDFELGSELKFVDFELHWTLGSRD